MSDTTSLVISVISLSGTVLATLLGAYLTYYNDERKARRDVNNILLKYRDPLLLSAQDLQARLYGLCDRNLLIYLEEKGHENEMYHDMVYIYTAYVVGQYLSWTWILRRQAQFMALMSSSPPKWTAAWTSKSHDRATTLVETLDKIKKVFNDDVHRGEEAFILFKANQTAIGEIMSCQDDKTSEYYCMGFATFTQRWKNGARPPPLKEGEQREHLGDDRDHEKIGEYMAGVAKIPDRAFRDAFASIEDGVKTLWDLRKHKRDSESAQHASRVADGRLRRLQHLLLDLTEQLDPKGLLNNKEENARVMAMPGCKCTTCLVPGKPGRGNRSPRAPPMVTTRADSMRPGYVRDYQTRPYEQPTGAGAERRQMRHDGYDQA